MFSYKNKKNVKKFDYYNKTGDSLKQLLDKIIDWILNHQHQSTTPGSPVLPVLATPTAINMVTEINIEKSNIDNIKSKKNFGA